MLLPEEATLFVASSMPVRDIETFWPVRAGPAARALQPRRQRHRRHRLLGLRGGRRRAGTGRAADRRRRARARHRRPARGAALGLEAHDRAARQRRRRDLRLPGGLARREHRARSRRDARRARQSPARTCYTRHIATPTGLDFAHAAALYGLAHERVASTCASFARRSSARSRRRQARRSCDVRSDRAQDVELPPSQRASAGCGARSAACSERCRRFSPPAAAAAPAA